MKETFEYSRSQVETRKLNAENGLLKKKIWQVLLPAAFRSLFVWQLIVRELIAVGLIWGIWFFVQTMIPAMEANGDDMQLFKKISPFLFWSGVYVSGLSFLAASFKSALPAVLTLIVSVILAVVGIGPWHLWALMAAGVATVIYAIGFAIRNGEASGSSSYQEWQK